MLIIVLLRLVLLLPMLLGLSALTFLAMHMIPGDLALLLVGPEGVHNPVVLENIRREYGLDRPLVVQYGAWLGKVVRGDFGDSLRLRVPVLDEIARRLPLTLELSFLSVCFGLLLGGTIGALAALRGGRWAIFGRVFAVLGVAVPNFLLGTLLILLGARFLPFLPTLQYVPFTEDPAQHLLGLLYPVVALGTGLSAAIAENSQAAVAEAMGLDHVRVGRAKGLTERSVVSGHVLRNAAIPLITVVGLQAAYLLGGTIIVETVFALPGLGRLALSAVTLRDYPLMQGIVLVVATMVLLANLAADLAYGLVDPRVRVG